MDIARAIAVVTGVLLVSLFGVIVALITFPILTMNAVVVIILDEVAAAIRVNRDARSKFEFEVLDRVERVALMPVKWYMKIIKNWDERKSSTSANDVPPDNNLGNNENE